MFEKFRRALCLATLCSILGSAGGFALAETPSFDCTKARRPAEFAICNSDALARLDNINARAYSFLKYSHGSQFADLIGAPYLLSRYKCGYDEFCIQSSYLEEIRALQSVGAPIEYPAVPGTQASPAARSATASAAGSSGPELRVPMVEVGGTYSVPVTINGQITLDFVVDSGASDVQVPKDVVSTLIRTGTITDQDFIGSQTYVLADGSKVPSERFIIRSLKVGDRNLVNVTASVADASGSLLLGQSFLTRFGSWSMDNMRHVLVLNADGNVDPQLPVSTAIATEAAPVQGFYLALSSGNGQAAANFIVPEKRIGPFDPEAMTKYYGAMPEPLHVKSIDRIDGNSFLVDYHFRGVDKTCDGKAIVKTVVREGIGYIDVIRALSGC